MNTITEKVNELMKKTGCTSEDAIKTLEYTNGDYYESFIILQEKGKKKKEEYTTTGKDVIKIIKKLIKEGNITKIKIKKGQEILLNIPVNAVAVGVVLLPFASMLGSIAAVATDCCIEVERKGNVIVDVNQELKKAGDKMETYANKFMNKL